MATCRERTPRRFVKMAARTLRSGVACLFFFAASAFQIAAYGGEPVSGAAEARNEAPAIASDQLTKALAEFNRGAALLEKYRYSDAAKAFEGVLDVFPDWTAARFNMGVAYLNQYRRVNAQDSTVQRARRAFERVLEQNPDHLHARFCLGLHYQYLDQKQKALECFMTVHKADKLDPHVAYKCGETLVGLNRKDEAKEMLQKAITLDPGFISAVYRKAAIHMRAKERDKAYSLFRRFKELRDTELTRSGFAVSFEYAQTGKYHRALGVESLPLDSAERAPARRILLSPEIKRLGVDLKPWEWDGGKVNLPGVAVGDFNGDCYLDLVLTATGADGATSVWLNDGNGGFCEGPRLTDKGVSPCLGDVDNDGHVDVWLGRAGPDVLFRNDGNGNFSPVSSLPVAGNDRLTACARLVDLDLNGGLDLVSLRWAHGSVPAVEQPSPAACSIYANPRSGVFPDIAGSLGLAFPRTPLAAIVYDDFDNDLDMDLLLFPARDKPIAWVNDRAGKYHLLDAEATGLGVAGAASAASGDPHKTGNRDLLIFTGKETHLYRNRGGFRFELDQDFTNRCGRLGGTGGQFADMDNDGDLDIVIADSHRRQCRGPALLINEWPNRRFSNAVELDPGCLLNVIQTHGNASCVVADFNNDGKCDILLAEMNEQPLVIENVTCGGHFVALDLVGTRPRTRMSQSNSSAIGARVEVKSGTVYQQYVVGRASGPTAMAPLRIHAGLGDNAAVQWLRIRWPDAVLQAELELAADQVLKITETQRLSTTCPHLYAWDGSRFDLVSDFGGVGGLGYWIAPGSYAMPDPTEYVYIPRLEPVDGQYVLQALESLEETVYLDEAKLVAVDHPADMEIRPHEMMAINASPPPFEIFCFREPIEPVAAIDHRGINVTERICRIDRSYAGATDVDDRFYGYAENHFVELDFGDRLQGVAAGSRLILVLYGSTQYPYSSINYAAYQAGLRLKAPSIHALRDGQWVALFDEVGCPAGMQHVMTVDVTERLLPRDRRIRISSNMEVYWDKIFLAAHLPEANLRISEVCAQSADLHFLGYARAYSPDGRRPELYDYDKVERSVPWKLMKGNYTRYGDVAELVQEADDCYVLMGRGDELTLRFLVDEFGPIAPGHRRTFLAKFDVYTKDMDLYSACSDNVEPLPFHGMRSYPYGSEESYPQNTKTRDYRRRFNTRRVQ